MYQEIIVTTGPNIEGHHIQEYKGIVFGEVIEGINMFRDIGAGIRNIFGGRSKGYEDSLLKAREEAIWEMKERAYEMGANAVIAAKMDYETLGTDNGMIMVTISGTAVVID